MTDFMRLATASVLVILVGMGCESNRRRQPPAEPVSPVETHIPVADASVSAPDAGRAMVNDPALNEPPPPEPYELVFKAHMDTFAVVYADVQRLARLMGEAKEPEKSKLEVEACAKARSVLAEMEEWATQHPMPPALETKHNLHPDTQAFMLARHEAKLVHKNLEDFIRDNCGK